MTRWQRFWAYLVSRRNLTGLAFALFGGVLMYFGLLGGFGPLVILALYGLGALLTPRDKMAEVNMQRRYSESEIRDHLDRVVRKARQRRLPREIMAKVEGIQASIESILPQLMLLGQGDRTMYTIRQTALEYLPEALQNYMNLPPFFASNYPLRNGKTARVLLGEQLDLLDREMKSIVADYAVNDMQKLLAHGRFLEQKFHQDEIFTKTTKQPEKQPAKVRR